MQSSVPENRMRDDLPDRLHAMFPPLTPSEQKVSLQIYRLLRQGGPVSREMLAEGLRLPLESIDGILNGWWGVESDHLNRIVGFRGLGLRPTRHRFEVDGKTLYTWCAWDTLFLPEILQTSARVESQCETTQVRIHLDLNPERVEHVEPRNAVISFLSPEAARAKENVVRHFCRFVHFFESEESGLAWTRRHPGTFLLTIDEAHWLGQKINAVQYGALGRRSSLSE